MKVFCLLLLLCVSVGCSSMRSLVFSESQDKVSIGEQVESFHKALYWGEPNVAVAYVAPEFQGVFQPIALERSEKEKLVEFKIQSIALDTKQENATVQVKVQFYTVPQMLVKTRIETQKWTLYHLQHWLFVKIEDEKML